RTFTSDLTAPEIEQEWRRISGNVPAGDDAVNTMAESCSPDLWASSPVSDTVVEAVSAKIAPDSVAQPEQPNRPHVAHNSGENEWYTPPEYIAAARAVLGSIDVDPASSDIAQETVCASVYYTKQDDGLAKLWRGKVWMNPPYSVDLIGRFIEKLCD